MLHYSKLKGEAMLTPLGKFLRKLRLDNDQLLRDMAERLEMPSSTI